MNHVGFTGTRYGMTDEQIKSVETVIKEIKQIYASSTLIGVHGDCVGADSDFDRICKQQDIRTVCLPCLLEHMRAYVTDAIAEPVAPMERNRQIVKMSDVVIACPFNYEEIKSGSGTWATIRFTKRANKLLYIVYPDGSIVTVNHGLN